MKFTIKKNTLLKALSIVEQAISSKTVIDSLKGIQIKANPNEIIFIGSSSDISIKYIVQEDFNIQTPGLVILPASHLHNIIKKTVDNDITFTTQESTCLVETLKSKITLVSYTVDSYPDINFNEDFNNCLELKKTMFAKAYNQNKRACTLNPIKPILTGINLKVTGNQLLVNSTDSKRLAVSNFLLENQGEHELTLAKDLYARIIKIFEYTNDDIILIKPEKNTVNFKAKNITVRSRVLEGKYPSISHLIPDTNAINFSILIDCKQLQATLEKVLLLSQRDSANVSCKVSDGELQLSSYFKEIGGIEELCAIEKLDGSPFDIAFDPEFLLDAISAIRSDKLIINFIDEISPFAIYDPKTKDNIQVISPIRMT